MIIRLVLLLLFVTAPVAAAASEQPASLSTVGDHAQFRGVIIVEKGGKMRDYCCARNLLPDRIYSRVQEQSRASAANVLMPPLRDWRWASVTKQIVAVLVMQEVEKGRIDLDKPLATYLPGFRSPNARTATVRQLLQHRAGLPDPDETAKGADGFPDYYQPGWTGSRDPLTGYCAGPVTGPPGGNWRYNNCDYIVAGALLEAVTGKKWPDLVKTRIALPAHLTSLRAGPNIDIVPGFIDDGDEPPIDLAAFGAAASLHGEPRDLVRFDRALLDHKFLKPATLAELWKGDPTLGFMALGQWVFTVPLKGCAAPVKIVERRGEIGGVGIRNFIMPDRDTIVVAFTNRGGFDFGEVWQGKGFSYEMLSAATCR